MPLKIVVEGLKNLILSGEDLSLRKAGLDLQKHSDSALILSVLGIFAARNRLGKENGTAYENAGHADGR